MKKKVFAKKLTLNKETIATLNDKEMHNVYAGGTVVGPTCNSMADCCTPTTENNSIILTDTCE